MAFYPRLLIALVFLWTHVDTSEQSTAKTTHSNNFPTDQPPVTSAGNGDLKTSEANDNGTGPNGSTNPSNIVNTAPTSDSDVTNVTSSKDTNHAEDSGHGGGGIELIPVHFTHVKYPFVFSIVVILAAISKLGFHFSHFLASKVPESCVLIVLGVLFGVILHYTGVSKNITLFSPHEFFLYLLPPIILEAAFSLHDRTFAENIGGVLLYAILGTVINCFLIGVSMYGLYQTGAMEEINSTFVQLLVFSSLIVAVDPVAVLAVFQEVGVNNTLYFLVFGESLLNDGVTVVLYKVMQIFNTLDVIDGTQIVLGIVKFFIVVGFGGILGVVCGIASSFLTKHTNPVKVVEPLIIFGFAYLSYVVSEVFEFSGIVSIIACGIIQVHYAFHNITNKSKLAIKFFAKVMATASEIVIFLFLGIVTINQNHDWKTGFTLWTLLFCIVYRFLVTFGISVCINKFSAGRVRKIKADEMFMISYGGLRGAVCFSLVALIDEKEVPMKNMFVTTTLFVIFFTVFIQGGTIKYLVKKLRIKLAQTGSEMSINEELTSHVFDHVLAGIEEILGYTTGNHHIKEKLDHIDDRWIRPKLLRNATKSELDDISHYYEKLVMKEHYKNLQLSGAKLPRVKTEIRHLDSEVALEKLGHDVDEHEAYARHQDIIERRNDEHKEENRKHGDNIHKFFSNTMHTVRALFSKGQSPKAPPVPQQDYERLHLKVHDKNLVHDRRHHLISHLRNKHKRNKALENARTSLHEGAPKPPPLSLSFNIDGTRAFDEENRRPSQVKFTLQDTVMEEDETTMVTVERSKHDNEDEDRRSDRSDSSGRGSGKVTFML